MAKKLLLVSAEKTIVTEEETGAVTELSVNGKPIVAIDGSSLAERAKKERVTFYQKFLESHFENLIILSGAGTSVHWGGLTMKELWGKVETKITQPEMLRLCKAIGFIEANETLSDDKKDLEKLLSRANIAKEFVTTYENKPINISELVDTAEKIIFENCKFDLKREAPHELFLNKVTNRKLKDPRVKIFTLNYDTLFEQAAIEGGFTVIDGFSFSTPRTLSGRNFDYDIIYRENSRIKEEESFVPKVFHLYKPHGSINWDIDSAGKIILNDKTTKPLMIFPKDSKYENSYEQPFFEMMSRFQQNLRKENVLLICLGFSFGDKHIVTAIKEAVTQNASFRLLIVNRTIRENDTTNWFIERAKKQSSIILVAEEFKDFTENFPTSKIYSDGMKDLNDNGNA